MKRSGTLKDQRQRLGSSAIQTSKTSAANHDSKIRPHRIKSTLELLAAIATIGGIIFAIQQYVEAKADARINTSLSYVARFNSDPTLKSFINLYNTWETADEQQSKPDDPTEAQIQFIEGHHLKWDAILLGDFFDQLYVCVSREICDQNLAVTMLGRDIETVYVLSGRFLDAQLQPTGCGLKALFEVAHPRLNFSRLSAEEKSGKDRPRPQLRSDACPSF